MQAQDKSSLVCIFAGMIGSSFQAGLKDFVQTRLTLRILQGADFAIQDLTRCQPLPCRSEGPQDLRLEPGWTGRA